MERLTVFDGEFWIHKNFPPVEEDRVDEFIDCVKELAARLAAIEDILGDEYDLGRLKVIMDAERYGGLIVGYPPDDPGPKGPPGCCPNCGRYGGISWDAQTDVSTCALCGWTDAEAALRREQE